MRSDSALVTARKQSYSYVRSLSEPVLLSQSSEDFLPFYSTDSEVSSYFSEYRHELVIVNTSIKVSALLHGVVAPCYQKPPS